MTISIAHTNLNRLTKKILAIGEQMVANAAVYGKYEDLVCKPDLGIIPRALILETEGRKLDARGSVVVGINPGRASGDEKRHYLKNRRLGYRAVIEYWEQEISKKPYYTRLRELMDEMGLKGPILWTELVKCESVHNGILRTQTIRDDINRYLFQEIQYVPADWPLIGVGHKAYEILSYRFPDRTVIGVPHAIGSFGQFHKLLRNRTINPKSIVQLKRALRSRKHIALAFRCARRRCEFV